MEVYQLRGSHLPSFTRFRRIRNKTATSHAQRIR